MRIAVSLLLAGVAAACGGGGVAVEAASWPEADRLFHAEPAWLGGDGALSIPLGGERVLWLFGDSFVATSARNVRTESEMVRNTIAIQVGLDPRSAAMDFVWRTEPDGSPGPFFADEGEEWHWPAHGVRLTEGPLLVFLAAVRATPGRGLGFEEAGYRIVRIDNPDDPPLAWSIELFDGPGPARDPDATVGIAVVREGEWLLAATTALAAQHIGWLARFRIEDLLAGRLAPEWWAGPRGFLSAAALGDDAPEPVMDEIGSECSMHLDPRLATYVHVASRGFGATTIAVRTAPAASGPWTAPADAFTPPESQGPDPFVYAAKAHPELTTGDPAELVVTYATNSFEFADLFTPEGEAALYWPRFVRIRLGQPGGD